MEISIQLATCQMQQCREMPKCLLVHGSSLKVPTCARRAAAAAADSLSLRQSYGCAHVHHLLLIAPGSSSSAAREINAQGRLKGRWALAPKAPVGASVRQQPPEGFKTSPRLLRQQVVGVLEGPGGPRDWRA